jgi:uncharacterized protein (TIGR02996 family)
MPTTSSDGAALLRAICDNPDEDTPRLAYADWLDEQGGESNIARAEFIRLQITAAAKCDDPDKLFFTDRETELFRPHFEKWATEAPKFPGVSVWTGNDYGNGYIRGFPFSLYAKSVRSYLKAAPKLFPQVPVTKVRFADFTPKTAEELANSPWVSRIQYLDQLNGIPSEALEALGRSPHMGNLRRVLLRGGPTEAMRLFLANPSLTRLMWFNTMQCSWLGSGIVAALLASPSAPVLEEVSLFMNGIGADAVADIPALVQLPKLRELNLSDNKNLGDVGLIALAGATSAGAVRVWYGQNGVTDLGAKALLKSAFMRGPARFLGVPHNKISDAMKAKLKKAFGERIGV